MKSERVLRRKPSARLSWGVFNKLRERPQSNDAASEALKEAASGHCLVLNFLSS